MNYYCPGIPRISNDRYTGAADVAIYVKKHVHAPRLEDTWLLEKDGKQRAMSLLLSIAQEGCDR